MLIVEAGNILVVEGAAELVLYAISSVAPVQESQSAAPDDSAGSADVDGSRSGGAVGVDAVLANGVWLRDQVGV